MSRTPAATMTPSEPDAGFSARRVASASRSTRLMDETRALTSGQSPDSAEAMASRMKKPPNPAPAASAVSTELADPLALPDRSWLMRSTAPSPSATPSSAVASGRSPWRSPNPTGSAAEVTAVVGATTDITPVASDR
ncbi:hypothetical protein ACFSTC_07770 [Nonomuraea ferruginea]